MKRNKYFIVILLIVVVSTLMTGCKKKIEEKITEKIIESATGADVDINKDTTTIKTGDSTTQVGSNIKWPKDKMGNLKELKANIIMLTEDKEKTLTYITFDSLKKEDAEKYVESIRELGYKSVFENTTSDGFMFSGNDEDGSEVIFAFYNDGTGSLSYTEKQFMFTANPYDTDKSEDSASTKEIDMTDAAPWPKDFFKEIPELEGKITGVSSSGNTEKYIYLEYVTKEDALDYINKIKDAGFIEGATESTISDYLDYEAGNAKGDYIIFNWNSGNYSSITMIKGE